MSTYDKGSTDEIGNEYFTIKTKTTIVKTYRYDIYILTHIESPSEYIEFFNLLSHAKETDDIHIYINSGGGFCSTAIQMVNAMGTCEAHITCYASGTVASAATWIFLAGNSFIMEDDIMFMCHYFSAGFFGKGNEIEAKADFTKKFYRKYYRNIYKHFMTEDEIEKMIEGKDYYFTQKQVAKRLTKKFKILKKLKKLEEKEKKTDDNKVD